jgi:activator of HSP90 ATPase
MAEPIHQQTVVASPVERVFESLADAKSFAAFTGAPAEIDASPGGAISLFGGRIVGRTIEVKRNQRVVQAWRSGAWPEGVFSIVRFELSPEGDKTRVTLDQAGFPDDARAMLEGGWDQMYWQPLKNKLAP